MALSYLSGMFISEPGGHSKLCAICLVCLSQNQASIPGSLIYLWFVYLRSRYPLLALLSLQFV